MPEVALAVLPALRHAVISCSGGRDRDAATGALDNTTPFDCDRIVRGVARADPLGAAGCHGCWTDDWVDLGYQEGR